MAADNRPYKSKEQDGQGNEIIIRDQQLVEQASQTTMASGEYFEIVDIDGRMAKIPKANMVDIVREALGSLLNGLSDQTTVTKVPSLNGNTLGASTVSTLASVLGVSRTFSLQPGEEVLTGCFKGALYVSIEGTGSGGGLFIYNKMGDTPDMEYCTSDFGHTNTSGLQLYRPSEYSNVCIKNNTNLLYTIRINESLCKFF